MQILVCSECQWGLVAPDELIVDEADRLKEAVYAFALDVLDREVTCYSATNSHTNRFDVIRVQIDDCISLPRPSPPVPPRDSFVDFLNRLRASHTNDSSESAEQILADLEAMSDPQPTTSEEEGSTPATPDGFILSDRVRITGIPTDEFSWFPGFEWSLVSCIGCASHLGWAFSREGKVQFIGFIVTRLRERNVDT
jgi:hypothetical protein